MVEPVSREDLARIRKLVLLVDEVRHSQWGCEVTRLTVLKKLCQDPAVAHRFVTYLARKTVTRVQRGQGRSTHGATTKNRHHRQMMAEALAAMEVWQQKPTGAHRQVLLDLLGRIPQEQNEYQRIKWGAVRIIHDWDLLLFEHALRCLLAPQEAKGDCAYQMARDYAERYDSRRPRGLVPASVPLLKDIADFWTAYYGIKPGADPATTGQEADGARRRPADRSEGKRSAKKARARSRPASISFTHRQGQFLAFIHLYRRLHRKGPAEMDLLRFFRVTPPTVHDMIVRLAELGLVTREAGVPRSVRVAIPEEDIPPLEAVEGPPC
jgi:hypothetical protein